MTDENQFPEDARNDWPFRKMELHDTVTIKNPEFVDRGQLYAHVYGRQSGKKFKTRKLDGILYVKRIA